MQRASIFSQKLDRIAFTAYLLGAVVPLAALAVVVERFVLPTLEDRLAVLGLVSLVCSIAVLSFGAFLTLRRTSRDSLARMDGDNRRLTALLDVSSALAGVQHGTEAADTAARTALSLTGARAAFVFVRAESGELQRLGSAGEECEKLSEQAAGPLLETAKLVMSGGRPALRGREAEVPAMAAAPLPGEAAAFGAAVVAEPDGRREFSPADLDSLGTLAGLASVALHNADLREAQRNFFTHVTDMLVSALDANLGYHSGHGTRVAQYANRMGRKLGLDDHRLQRLHFAALLHDVGMLKLDRKLQIDKKSCARHVSLGARMLGRIRLWQDIAPIVLHHHEWFDGSGYPEGISGAEIPLESRIISICDAFDTIVSPTSYKPARPFEEAVAEIENCAGTQFDPELARAFLKLVRSGDITPVEPA